MTALELQVLAIDDSVSDVRTLTLGRPDGRPLPSFTPGSHLMIECGPVANAYSLTGDAVMPSTYSISVLLCRNGSGGSQWVHRELRTGDSVVARAPRSAFAPVLKASRHLLVAAGIGITPMVSHLRSAIRWGRQVELLYVHREGRGAHLHDIAALTDDARVFTERATFSAALLSALAGQPFGTHLYVCGPASFIDDVTAVATDLGWPDSRIHVEHFGIGALDSGEPFEVSLVGSGDRFIVDSGVSLLAALQARGHDVPNLCRHGVCGQCRVAVTGGDVLHRDLFLTDDEKAAGDSVMCCVSRAAGARLELAL